MEVYRRCGIELPEFDADYDDVEKISQIIHGQQADTSAWKKCDRADLPVPCILAIRFGVPKGVVNHTGCYIGDGKFIHIRENIGVCVDRLDSPAWRRVIEGCYEYAGQEKGYPGNHTESV
jgi:cell wall-associated NlpC family hydrolase